MERTPNPDIMIKDDDDDDDDSFLGAMHLNRDIPVPPNSPVLELEDPNEEIGGAKLSNEEERILLEPTDVSGATGENPRKRKTLLDEEISSETVCEQDPSLEDTSDVLETESPKESLMKSKKGGARTLLSTSTHSLLYDELKKLFSKGQPSSDINPGTSVQKEPGSKEEGKCSAKGTSVMEEPNLQEEPNQPQTGSSVTQESVDSIVEDPNTLPSGESSSTEKQFSLAEFCKNSDRRQTASAFYSLLLLKKEQAIEVSQSAPYEDIKVTEGPKFHDL